MSLLAATCRKCGSQDIAKRFCAGHNAGHNRRHYFLCNLYPDDDHTDERLEHHCRHCAYEWYTRPMDAQPEEAP